MEAKTWYMATVERQESVDANYGGGWMTAELDMLLPMKRPNVLDRKPNCEIQDRREKERKWMSFTGCFESQRNAPCLVGALDERCTAPNGFDSAGDAGILYEEGAEEDCRRRRWAMVQRALQGMRDKAGLVHGGVG